MIIEKTGDDKIYLPLSLVIPQNKSFDAITNCQLVITVITGNATYR